MTADEVYKTFLDTRALLEGHFELRSGLHSDKYFQCAIVLSHPRAARALCEALAKKLKEKIPGMKAGTVISPAMGGIIVGQELAHALDARAIFAEKKDDALVLRRFAIERGQRYIVAEDVVTRGGRVQETLDIVVKAGGVVEAVALLVDRSGGKASLPCPMVSLLEMEPVTYEPAKCPLCRKGLPLVHPGS
jgi:orotate phosphoribosyltransferase